jgi:hypothetical protein
MSQSREEQISKVVADQPFACLEAILKQAA